MSALILSALVASTAHASPLDEYPASHRTAPSTIPSRGGGPLVYGFYCTLNRFTAQACPIFSGAMGVQA